jgi:hypothetical protein
LVAVVESAPRRRLLEPFATNRLGRGLAHRATVNVDDAGLPALLDAIRHLEGCEATWAESVPVHETSNGETVWAGEVQVFDLVKHPKAKRAYAWSHATTGTRRQFHVVLHLPPVDSPVMAVKTAVYAEYRRLQKKTN